MTRALESFIHEIESQVMGLHHEYTLALWDAATTGTPEANQHLKETQAALMRFWADPDRYATAKAFDHSGDTQDPIVTRQIRVITLSAAKAQQDEETIEKLTALEAQVRGQYYNFRARIDGKMLSDNELEAILSQSRESAEVRTAWEASKQIGAQVAEQVRELARIRNEAARAQGYRDHFERSLALNEIDESELFEQFDGLEGASHAPFEALKAEIDHQRAAHFGVDEDELRPWHYGDRFFQNPPPLDEVDLDAIFAELNPTELATATYDSLGLEVRDILERSDLYAREGKNQHAFCVDIDRDGDVRTLNNLERNHHWVETLHHELGHAVYNKHIDRSLPWLLRRPPHTLSTEAIAIMMGELTSDRHWLHSIAGVPQAEAERLSHSLEKHVRAQRLIFTRWCLVMTNFERALYADPEGDLDSRWWDLVARFQMVHRPDGRRAPDWAAKYHIALSPVYYQNYQLGHLVMAQVANQVQEDVGGPVGQPEAGRWLVERVFHPGASRDWAAHVEAATGAPLSPRYFVESLA